MVVSIMIVLPTWLVAASLPSFLASVLACLVPRSRERPRDQPEERPREQPEEAEERPKDERGAERTGELAGPLGQPGDADWQFVIEPTEPQDRADREYYVTLRAGWRVHTRPTCPGLKNAKEVVTSTKDVVENTLSKTCFRNE